MPSQILAYEDLFTRHAAGNLPTEQLFRELGAAFDRCLSELEGTNLSFIASEQKLIAAALARVSEVLQPSTADFQTLRDNSNVLYQQLTNGVVTNAHFTNATADSPDAGDNS